MADDLLKPEEIEALLKAAGSGPAAGGSAPCVRPMPTTPARRPADPSDDPPGPGQAATSEKEKSPTERLLEQAQAGLAAAVSPTLQSRSEIPAELGSPSPYEFRAFDHGAVGSGGDGVGLHALQASNSTCGSNWDAPSC